MENSLVIRKTLLQLPDLKNYLVDSITMMHTIAGQSIKDNTGKETVLQVTLLIAEIQNYFPSLTVDEFEKAFNKGVRGEFGEYFGLNLLSYSKWIKAFKTSHKTPVIETPTQYTAQQIADGKSGWEKKMIEQFKLFKETGRLDIAFPILQYNTFVDYGLLKKDDYVCFIDTAKIHAIEKAKMARLKKPSQRHALTEQIRRIEQNELGSKDNELIIQQAKYEAIRAYYDSITELKF